MRLFPLHRCGGFAGDIVGDAVDVGDFVDDADGDTVQDFVGDSGPLSGHKVGGGDGA